MITGFPDRGAVIEWREVGAAGPPGCECGCPATANYRPAPPVTEPTLATSQWSSMCTAEDSSERRCRRLGQQPPRRPDAWRGRLREPPASRPRHFDGSGSRRRLGRAQLRPGEHRTLASRPNPCRSLRREHRRRDRGLDCPTCQENAGLGTCRPRCWSIRVSTLPRRCLTTVLIVRYADSPTLTMAQMQFFARLAVPPGTDPRAVSPLQVDDLSELASALVVVPTFDPVADHGRRYAERLAAAGTPAREVEYRGATHTFLSMPGVVPQAKQARAEVLRFLLERFGA